jgi:hypothetical protein
VDRHATREPRPHDLRHHHTNEALAFAKGGERLLGKPARHSKDASVDLEDTSIGIKTIKKSRNAILNKIVPARIEGLLHREFSSFVVNFVCAIVQDLSTLIIEERSSEPASAIVSDSISTHLLLVTVLASAVATAAAHKLTDSRYT